MHDRKFAPRLKATLPFLIILIAFIALAAFYAEKIECLIDSDTASDLVMARELAEEGKLLTDRWFYSSELHVIKTQLVTVPLFLITNDFHQVRILSGWIWFAVLIISYLYFCRQLRFPRLAMASGVLLILPFSREYFQYVLMGCYYIPYISVGFFTVGLLFQSVRGKFGVKSHLLLGLGGLISILSGMGGPRQLLLLYLPLCAAGIILALPGRNEIPSVRALPGALGRSEALRFAAGTLFLLLCCLFGYLVNLKILSRIFSFTTWDDLAFKPFSFASLEEIFCGLLTTFGYQTGKVFSEALMANLSCFALCLLTLLAVVNCLKQRKTADRSNLFLAVFLLANLSVFMLVNLFTTGACAPRYNISILVFAFPLIALNLREVFSGLRFHRFFAGATAAVVLAACLFNYAAIFRTDKTKYLREVGDYLTENGYANGYATYWKGNVLTELTNGAVEMWAWCDSTHTEELSKLESVDQINEWLQLTSHATERPEGRVFILLSRREYAAFPWRDHFGEGEAVFTSSNGNYTVYGFADYDALCARLYAE